MQIWRACGRSEAVTIILSVRNFLIARITFYISILQGMTLSEIRAQISINSYDSIYNSNFNERYYRTILLHRFVIPTLLFYFSFPILLSFSLIYTLLRYEP